MGKYTDDEIRAMPKITAKIAADYLGISPVMVTLGMRNDLLPIGFAVKKEERYSTSWSYNIIAERLIAYNHGRINEVQMPDRFGLYRSGGGGDIGKAEKCHLKPAASGHPDRIVFAVQRP